MKLIDVGAFNGDSALHFISYPDIDFIDAYEPNSDFVNLWRAISEHYPNIRFINKAVYINNGVTDYYKRPKDLPLGSTIMKSKIQDTPNETSSVDILDILDIVPDEPYCLKLDAEGAEYDILERIIKYGKPENIDRLYVEWHDSKMTSDNYARQVVIVNYFRKKLQSWL